MILVTSAYGNVGRQLIPQLIKKGLDVRAMDINPDVEKLKEIGVKEIIVGDASKKEIVEQAITGCDQVMYIPPMFTYIETKMAKLAIDTAVKQKVRQFVMMSVTHSNMSTLLQHTQKLKAEEYLIYAGLKHQLNYTILQPMHYNHNFNVNAVHATGEYTSFYDIHTKLSYVDGEDVGMVAAKVLSEDGHNNATYELVNHDFYSPQDLVDVYNEVSGKTAIAKHVEIEDFLDMIHFTDSYGRECFRALADTYSRYGIAGNPNVLTWLLGRKPTSFKEYVIRELGKM